MLDPSLSTVLATIDSRQHQSLSSLKEFLSIPSVSTKPEHRPDMQRCAQWLADQLKFAAMDVAVMPTTTDGTGHPIVVAKNKHQPNRPTVLMYGHYDVQPPEPLELWETPPFEPTVRDGKLYARGSADDKGQVWAHVEALTAWQAHGGPPVNVTLLIEGEEEIGSDHLAGFIQQHRDQLRADLCVISDTNQFASGIPALTYSLRGLVYMEVFLTGPSHDLHSGLFGGAVPNPANVLGELIASLHNADGTINLPGLYEDVLPLSEQERKLWKQLPFSDAEFLAQLGLSSGTGEQGYNALEQTWARPTCDVNGISAGYQGSGAKTVIPSKASAKISLRLVPNQEPAKVQALFEKTLRERCPDNVKIEFKQHGLAGPIMVPIDSAATRLCAEALEIGFGVKPTFMRGGGSIPVVELLKRELGVDSQLIGFGLPDDRVHSPNEKFDLESLRAGTRTAAALYQKLAELK